MLKTCEVEVVSEQSQLDLLGLVVVEDEELEDVAGPGATVDSCSWINII